MSSQVKYKKREEKKIDHDERARDFRHIALYCLCRFLFEYMYLYTYIDIRFGSGNCYSGDYVREYVFFYVYVYKCIYEHTITAIPTFVRLHQDSRDTHKRRKRE